MEYCSVGEKLDQLKRQYDEKLAQKEELRRKSKDMELKLDRAGKLMSRLAGERVRWKETVAIRTITHIGLEKNMSCPTWALSCPTTEMSWSQISGGNRYLSTCPCPNPLLLFSSQGQRIGGACSLRFSFAMFLSKPTAVHKSNIQGLPSDAFSTENRVIVTRGNRSGPESQSLNTN
ncbi:hypothetical protein cypCar_00000649 [Cyprinus carpio]|nr:hypothetical protein cypCar_00000649 [Cyprinus carpio]